MNEQVTLEIGQTGVARVSLNNPSKHNAFDDVIIRDLTEAFRQVDNDDSIKVMILQAHGKSFSAGGDLDWMKRMATYSYEENLADAKLLAEMLRTLNFMSKPTIARVQGAAFGGAVGLVSCCDIAVGSTNASFCLSEVKVGLVPATISPYVVTAIGERASRRYFLSAERFNANTALDLQLLSAVVEEHLLDDEVERFTALLLANGPQALKASKQVISDVANKPINEGLIELTCELIATVRNSQEGQEGLSAFLEKRSPNWKNAS